MIGRIVVDEIVMDVVQIRLEAGAFVVEAACPPNVTFNTYGDVALFGVDGTLVLSMPAMVERKQHTVSPDGACFTQRFSIGGSKRIGRG